jgi:hypothetical protein
VSEISPWISTTRARTGGNSSSAALAGGSSPDLFALAAERDRM